VTVTYTPTQIGHDVGAVWFPAAPNFTLGLGGFTGGIQYTLPVFPGGTGCTLQYRSLTLTLTPTAAPGGTGTLTIALVNDVAEAAYSNANLPSAQTTIPLYSAVHTFVVATPVSFTFNLGVEQLQGDQHVGRLETPMQVLGHSGFAGNCALVLTFTNAVSFDGTAAPLVGDEVPFLSGLPSHKRMLSRADFCPRCGQAIFRENLRPDGFTKTLVCGDCWDRAEQKYPPFKPPKEINP
jgi:hypothetical protein